MVEDLALARLGLGNEALIEDVEDILADLLELEFDLLTVLADDADVLVRALGLLLLLDAGDDAPRGTAGADDVLVGDREEVALVDCELAADLSRASVCYPKGSRMAGVRDTGLGVLRLGEVSRYLCDFLQSHVSHFDRRAE